MSNLSDFLPSTGGGSAPVNAVTARYSNDTTITDEDGSLWLRGGNIITENLANYPDATKSIASVNSTTAVGASNNLAQYQTAFLDTNAFVVKPDGTKLYCFENSNVLQFNMPTPWDVTSINSLESIKSVNGTVTNTYGSSTVFSPDGRWVYFTNKASSSQTIYQSEMTTPWDSSTIVYRGSTNPAQEAISLFFNNTGSIVYMVRDNADIIDEYPLSVPFDIFASLGSTLPAATVNYSVQQVRYSVNITISNDGTFLQSSIATINTMWKLSKPWDFSTASKVFRAGVPGLSSSSNGIVYDRDFTKAISIDGRTTSSISQSYDVSSKNYIGILSPSGSYDYVRIL